MSGIREDAVVVNMTVRDRTGVGTDNGFVGADMNTGRKSMNFSEISEIFLRAFSQFSLFTLDAFPPP